MGQESFEVDDPRGEFWLYRGGGRKVGIMIGGGGLGVGTSGLRRSNSGSSTRCCPAGATAAWKDPLTESPPP